MNISKGKVLKNREWSASTQKKLASMLGVSAMISAAALTACDFGTTSGDVTSPELSSSSENLPPESGVVEPPEPTCGEMPCDGEYPPSSSSVQPNSSSSTPVSEVSSSSSDYPDYPPLAGILPPQSSSSYAIDTLEITSGEIAPPDTLEPESGSPFDQSHDFSSSSQTALSSSSTEVLSSSSEREVEIDTTLTAGLPVIEESSSSEEFYVPAGDPVIPEYESSSSSEERFIPAGDPVLPEDPIYIDDPKD